MFLYRHAYILFIIYSNFIELFETACYDNDNKPIKCSPEFVNIAYNLKVIATNTCGDPPTEYCTQTSIHHYDNTYLRSKVCDQCDSRYADKSHSVAHLTDSNNQAQTTWWQSETMHEGIQYPNSVNLTLNFEKSFEVTYIQVKFHSPRPESFALYKRTTESSDWIPYQYYSASCEHTYGVTNQSVYVQRGNEAVALCTDEYSDIAPLTGASVAFSTLEGRPSAYSFDTSDELKEWVTATNVKISLNRLNTFGDEVFKDPAVLKSYYYAISDISIGGRCKCNGHADRCVVKQGENFDEKLKCDCQHNTDGADCEKCLPFYNDVPWAPATWTNPQECRPCDCNGMSNKCFFDRDLYDQSGHGGHCVDCQRNTDGVHCEHCKEGFYRSEHDNECIDCQCHVLGSESSQCDPTGKCRCKPGVVGAKCDRCDANHFDLTIDGCRTCNCSFVGSFDSPPICDSRDGRCRCKANVEGQNCDRCKPGFYNLDQNNILGCLPCFCNGHSSECTSSSNHYPVQDVSNFDADNEGWTVVDAGNEQGELKYDANSKAVYVYTNSRDVWFNAPSKYLGNQRKSYNQDIQFDLKFRRDYLKSTRKDVLLENNQLGIKIHRQLTINEQQEEEYQTFTIKLKETENWIPSLSAKDFQRLLSNLTAIRVRASLSPNDHTYLRNFRLNSAQLADKANSVVDGESATWIEKCTCPHGYTGQFCESCISSYKREHVNGDASARCVPCSCNNHSLTCDQQSGRCDCTHNTIGEQCEKCLDGYYGNALGGTSADCRKCNCPNNGPCAEIFNYQSNTVEVVCLNCPEGTQGNLCELCDDGYFLNSTTTKCQKCTCNGNIDENAIGNCDTIDGRCLRCVYNTTGRHCEKCLSGYWGNALSSLKCHACDCFKDGTDADELQCSLDNGQCKCKPHVIGRQCDQCEENFWNISSGSGCVDCKCDPLGSHNLSCNTVSGQCFCKPGVVGLKCDKCAANHYEFTDNGCKPCDCDPSGSESAQCDDFGRCVCRDSIVGVKCNKCQENRFNFTRGCLKCDDCYTLVERQVTTLRKKSETIENTYESKVESQLQVNTKQNEHRKLSEKLDELKSSINGLHANFFSNPEQTNYADSLKSLADSFKNLNMEYKSREREYENYRKQFDDLERLASIVGNAELELSGVKLILDNAELKLQDRNSSISAAANGAEKSRIQALAKAARETTQSHTKQANNYANKFAQIVDQLKVTINKISFVPEKLRKNENAFAKPYELSNERIVALNDDIRMTREKLLAKTDRTKALIQSLMETNVYNKDDETDAANIGSFANDINQKGAVLKNEIDVLSQKINEFSTVSVANASTFAANALKASQAKEQEYKNLNDLVERNRNLTDSSIQTVVGIYKNLTDIVDTLRNFNDIYEQSKVNAQQAKSTEDNTNENYNGINSILQQLKDNLQQISADVENVRTKNNQLAMNFEKLNTKLNNMKDGSKRLENDTNTLVANSNSLIDKFKSIEVKLDQTRLLHTEHPNVVGNQQKKAENLITEAQSLDNRISQSSDAIDALNAAELSRISITKANVQSLTRKYENLLRQIDSKLKYDEEINELEKRNEKLNMRLNELEGIVPLLNKKISNLEDINSNLNSNQCYTKANTDNELRNIIG